MTPFEEILRRRRLRQPMDERLPDGRSVDELLNPSVYRGPFPPPAPQDVPDYDPRTAPQMEPLSQRRSNGVSVLTPQNQQVITRPRLTQSPLLQSPQLQEQSQPSLTPAPETAEGITRQRAVTFNPATGRPNEDYYRQRNDPMGLYSAYENWTPHGGKRGFKNALKAGALTAARVAQTTDNPAAILAGFGVGTAGGAVRPDFKNNLVRDFKLQQLGGEVGNQLKLQREQANIDMSQLVPVQLDNGQIVAVPARTAAGLQSRQQEIGLRGDTLEARKKRWDQLGEHEGARDAQALYNSGAADDSAELRAEIARRLRLPAGTVLPPRGLGNQIKIDDTGNYVVVNPRSGAVTDTGRGSFAQTQEQGRDARQQRAIAATDARTRYVQQQTNQRAGMRGGARLPAAVQTRVAAGVGALEGIKNELSQIDAQITQLDNASKGRDKTPDEMARITRLGRQREQKVNEAKRAAAELNTLDPNNESGVGEGGYPYRKPREGAQAAPSGGRTIEGAIDAFTRKVGRAPTADEIAKMKAALGQ